MTRRRREQDGRSRAAVEWFMRVFGREPTPDEKLAAEAHYGNDARRRQRHKLPERRCEYCRKKVPYVPDADNPLTGTFVQHDCDSPTEQLDMRQVMRALRDEPSGEGDR